MRLESTPQAGREDPACLWVVHNSVLASEGHCLDASGSDAQLYVRNCAILAGGVYDTNCDLTGLSYLIVDGLTLQDGGMDGVAIDYGANHVTLRNSTILRVMRR